MYEVILLMTAISRGTNWPPRSSDATRKSWNIPAFLWPQTRLGLRAHFTDVD